MNDETKLARLGPTQLKRLRDDVVLGSLYVRDYGNRYGIDPRVVCDFFMGYVEYLYEIAADDGFFKDHREDDCFAVFDAYDTRENLIAWHGCVAA